MTKKFFFVGEQPSHTAKVKGWTWYDGRLAAKQLFDTFIDLKINFKLQHFGNIVDNNCKKRCKYFLKQKRIVVAMGLKAHKQLDNWNIKHKTIVHPAARGKIRNKKLYTKHVEQILL